MKYVTSMFFIFLLFAGITFAQSTQTSSVQYPQGTPILDSDLDGLTDQGEVQLFQTNPNQADSDGDGLFDGVEVLNQTNPVSIQSPGKPSESIERPYSWYITRSCGIIAYLSLVLMIVMGLLMSLKMKLFMHPFIRAQLHCWISWMTLLFTALHMIALLFDKTYSFGIQALLIPFLSTFQPLYVGLGVLSFYILIVVVVSTRYMPMLSKKTWRIIHQSSLVAFVFITIHALTIGTDSSFWLAQVMYWVSGILIGGLTVVRIVKSALKTKSL